jgi:hypothetical protein
MEKEVLISWDILIGWILLWLILMWRMKQVAKYNRYLLYKAWDKDTFNRLIYKRETDHLNSVPRLLNNWKAILLFWTPLEKFVDKELLGDIHNFDTWMI